LTGAPSTPASRPWGWWCCWPRAQQRGQQFRIDVLVVGTPEGAVAVTDAFPQAMRELGYVDGGNIVYEYCWAHGVPACLPGFAAQLGQLSVDVIVVGPNPAITAVHQSTPTIPIVKVIAVDPVRNGFSQSLARPGGNVTGLTNDRGREMHGKMLGLLRETLPRVSTVGVLVQVGLGYERAAVEAATRQLGLRLDVDDATRASDEIQGAFAAMVRKRQDAYYMIGGPVLFGRRE